MDELAKFLFNYGVLGFFTFLIFIGQLKTKESSDKEVKITKDGDDRVIFLLTQRLEEQGRTLELVRKDRDKWQEVSDVQSQLIQRQHDLVVSNNRMQHSETT